MNDVPGTNAARRTVCVLAALVVSLVLASTGTASAALVTPTVPAGVNPGCADLGQGYIENTFDPPKDGTRTVGGNSITIDVHSNGELVNWTSTRPVDVVIVKGGDAGNAYAYTGLNLTSDVDLTSPRKNGALPEISHVTFCHKPRGTVVVTKDVDPGTDPEGFGFTSTNPLDGTVLGTLGLADDGAGGQDHTKTMLVVPGSYTVSETADDAWTLKSISCTDSGVVGTPSSGSVASRTATMVVDGTETVHCTFVNQKKPSIPVDPRTPPSDPEQPVQQQPVPQPAAPQLIQAASLQAPQPQPVPQTAASRRISGAARLQGPSGCVSRPFTLRVRGQAIRSIAIHVGDRRVKTLQAPQSTGQQTVTYRLDPRTVRRGRVARVTARVTFTAASGTRSRVLQLAVQRCRAVAPRFAG